MNFELIGFFLDIAVLVGLAATICFTLKLSRNLSVIRNDKQKLGELIASLSKNVDQANAAVINMRATGTKTADHLQDLINQAKLISDELQIMNEAGNSLAGRLERSSGSRPAASARPQARTVEPPLEPAVRAPTFFIHDRDFDEDDAGNEGWGADDDVAVPDELQTQAERELYAALRKSQKKSPVSGRH